MTSHEGKRILWVTNTSLMGVKHTTLMRVKNTTLMRVPNTTLMRVKSTTLMRVKNTTLMRVKNTTRMRVKNTTRNGTESRIPPPGAAEVGVIPIFMVFGRLPEPSGAVWMGPNKKQIVV